MFSQVIRLFLLIAIVSTTRVVAAHHAPHLVIPHLTPGGPSFDYMSAEGNRLLVSSSNFDGKAYLYDITTGTLLHTFNDPDVGNNIFGYNVALAGNHVVVGSYDVGLGQLGGAAYLFNAQTGELRHTFTEPTDGDNYFANEIVISGDKILIASEGGQNNNNPPFNAEVFLFDAVSGNLLHTFTQPDGINGFGQLIAMNGNNILIATSQDNEARVFHYDAITGALLNTIEKPEFARMDSISLEGDQFIVGNSGTLFGDQWNQRGRAFIYDLAGNLQHTLEHPIPGDDFFGGVVDLQGGRAIVTGHAGMRLDVVNPEPVVFDATTGEVIHFFADSAPYDNFSLGVLAGEHVVMSAVSYAPNSAHALMVYRLIPEPTSADLSGLVVLGILMSRRR